MKRGLFLLTVMVQLSLFSCHPHEYHLIKDEKTWNEAQKYCRENYTDLATVSDMTDLMRLRGLMDKKAWIGLYSQPGQNRTWHWSQPGVEISNLMDYFHHEEPNDVRGRENCGGIHGLKLRDYNCYHKKKFICFKASTVRLGSDNDYTVINERKTWARAQYHCRDDFTDLVSGLDQLNDEGFRNESGNETDGLWIGLFRDTWRWSDGSNSSFRKWNRGFKDGVSTRECATVDQLGDWGSDDCNEKKPFFCYDDKVILIEKKLTWEDALHYCRWFHSDLVSITNHHQQKWVQARAKKALTSYVWLGLYYTCALDLWFWVSNDLVCYNNWKETNERDDKSDFAAAMEKDQPHKWVKKVDTEEFNFICATKTVKNPT